MLLAHASDIPTRGRQGVPFGFFAELVEGEPKHGSHSEASSSALQQVIVNKLVQSVHTCWNADSPLDGICQPSIGKHPVTSLSHAVVAITGHNREEGA